MIWWILAISFGMGGAPEPYQTLVVYGGSTEMECTARADRYKQAYPGVVSAICKPMISAPVIELKRQ